MFTFLILLPGIYCEEIIKDINNYLLIMMLTSVLFVKKRMR